MNTALDELAQTLDLGSLLEAVSRRYGDFALVDHWQQGEFHHDVVIRVSERATDLPGRVLVVSSNCNGGIKEVLAFDEVPERGTLWSYRCPDANGPAAALRVLGSSRTVHWFDPCELLGENARSEYRPEFRRRQKGGGWEPVRCSASSKTP
jgi:hypothetical protein